MPHVTPPFDAAAALMQADAELAQLRQEVAELRATVLTYQRSTPAAPAPIAATVERR